MAKLNKMQKFLMLPLDRADRIINGKRRKKRNDKFMKDFERMLDDAFFPKAKIKAPRFESKFIV